MGHATAASTHAVPDGLAPWVREPSPGLRHMDLIVPGAHCAGCIAKIERGLKSERGIVDARLNLSTKRLAVDWREDSFSAQGVLDRLQALGFEARPFDAGEAGQDADGREGRELLRALAVAGFAAGNVMLLSVSVWSGADAATRDLFHWLSALIALPAVVFAGRPFFRSAARALRGRGLNMDVPISLAVILAAGMSLYETIMRGPVTYFDASLMLLFFLLIGRVLDHMTRARARSAATRLLSLSAAGATVVEEGGRRSFRAIRDIAPGMTVAVAPGERIPADGTVLSGESDIDRSLVTGEAAPVAVRAGARLEAGTMNLTGPLEITVSAAGEDTFLADIVRLMEAAERARARTVLLADRVARIYAPAVHVIALATFAAWLLAGSGGHAALMTAIAVLIITCPCALALAVPTVQVAASGVLFRGGVMLKDGGVLERLAEIDTVIFDKTGTLTLGRPVFSGLGTVDTQVLALAHGLARGSAHPLAAALARQIAERDVAPASLSAVREVPGRGLEGVFEGRTVRLGSRVWCGIEDAGEGERDATGPELCLMLDGTVAAVFAAQDRVRPGARATMELLKRRGLAIALLSGDRAGAVAALGAQLGIRDRHAAMSPQDKAAFVARLEAEGRKVLMVGDGINDAPALAAAHASMAPSSAADIGRTAAGLVFLGEDLRAVARAHRTACLARRLIIQNFALAVLYNLIAVPVAVAGLASPLVAAIAMSASSIVVTANALRLRLARGVGATETAP